MKAKILHNSKRGINKSFVLCLLLVLTNPIISISNTSNNQSLINRTNLWSEFRQKNPFNYQTVGLKRYSDGSAIIIISEPADEISAEGVSSVFRQLSISSDIKVFQHPIGYDGWVKDMVISVNNLDDSQIAPLKSKLFRYLYGTDYKAAFLDLEAIPRHTNFAMQDLNIQVSAEELGIWFINEREPLVSVDNRLDKTNLVKCFLDDNVKQAVYYSEKPGFIVWVINNEYNDQENFRICSRKFSLDSDLVLGAISNGSITAIIGRERCVPVYVLPPMRTETLFVLATTAEDGLSQSYERNNIFAGKLGNHKDYAPIYLSDELWHTEYGSILNITDQMLKSWSENGDVKYDGFVYKSPIDWAFTEGVSRDLHTKSLTYNWNTAGAGYCIDADNNFPYKIYAINRTGSLPISYIPGKTDTISDNDSTYLAEELAYDFFSGLSNPELVKVAEYASIYQIFINCRIHFPQDTDKIYSQLITNNSNEEQLTKVLESICNFHDRDADSVDGKPHYDSIQINAIEEYYEKAFDELLASCENHDDSLSVMLIMLLASPADNMIQETDSINNMIYKFRNEVVFEDKLGTLLDILIEMGDNYDIDEIDKAFEAKGTPFLRSVSHFIFNPREVDIVHFIEKYQNDVESITMYDISRYVAFGLLDKKEEIEQYAKVMSLMNPEEVKKALLAENEAKSSTWIKCPTIVQSRFTADSIFAVGGHDLSSKITPVKIDRSLAKGSCRVEMIEGKKVIYISPYDRGCITPDFLRRVERTDYVGTHSIEKLKTEARPRDIIAKTVELRADRGFNIDDHMTVIEMNQSGELVINGNTINSTESLYQQLATNSGHQSKNSPKKIVFKDISEDMVETIIDGTQTYILEKGEEYRLSNQCHNFAKARYTSQKDGSTLVVIPIEGTQIKAKEAKHVFKVPSTKLDNFKSVIKELLSNPEGIWSPFHFKRKMKSLDIHKQDFEEWLEFNKIVILIDAIKYYSYDDVIQEEVA